MAKRIVISGTIASSGQGYAGNTWACLQYVLGFRRLGFDTYYIEQIPAGECVNEQDEPVSFARSVNASNFRALVKRFDLGDHAGLLKRDASDYIGLSFADVEKLAPDIDLLVNLSGKFRLKSVLRKMRRRIYLDMDPGYSQIWQEQYGFDMNLSDHDVYVTVGLNLGKPDCPLPTCGIDWQSTLPPVVIAEWTTVQPPGKGYSTVADWRGFGPVEWGGIWYNQKADEFKRIVDLPHHVAVPLELCLFIHPNETDRIELERHGWQLVSPTVHAATPDTYRDYIFASRGEFTAVKHGYAAGRTGWFSDRSACYLAAGRPVIMQDTGIGAHVPTGTGVLTFTDIDSAAEAINYVESDYSRHAAAAVAFAREFLDSDLVLSRLLQLAGI
jgi:hypothetical protein